MSLDLSHGELNRLLAALPAEAPAGRKVVVGIEGDARGQTIYAGFKMTPSGEGLAWTLQASARHERTAGTTYGTALILEWP